MAGLIQMGRGRADQNAMQKMREQLDQVRNQNQTMAAELRNREQEVVSPNTTPSHMFLSESQVRLTYVVIC